MVDNFLWGQINLIVLALVCVSWWALKRGGHDVAVALPLSLAVVLKTYPVLLLPLLVFKKRYWAAAAVVTLSVVYAGLSYFLLPPGLWGDWLTHVMPTGGYGQRPFNLFLPGAPWNHNVNGFFIFLGDRGPDILGRPAAALTRPLTYLFAAAIVAVTLWLSLRCSRRGEGNRWVDYEVALFLLMMFLVAPLSWEHHLVYVLPAAMMSVRLLAEGGVPRGARVPLFAALCVAAWDFPRDDMFHYKGLWMATIPVKFYGAFALWACFAYVMWAALREPADEAGRGPAAA